MDVKKEKLQGYLKELMAIKDCVSDLERRLNMVIKADVSDVEERLGKLNKKVIETYNKIDEILDE